MFPNKCFYWKAHFLQLLKKAIFTKLADNIQQKPKHTTLTGAPNMAWNHSKNTLESSLARTWPSDWARNWLSKWPKLGQNLASRHFQGWILTCSFTPFFLEKLQTSSTLEFGRCVRRLVQRGGCIFSLSCLFFTPVVLSSFVEHFLSKHSLASRVEFISAWCQQHATVRTSPSQPSLSNSINFPLALVNFHHF